MSCIAQSKSPKSANNSGAPKRIMSRVRHGNPKVYGRYCIPYTPSLLSSSISLHNLFHGEDILDKKVWCQEHIGQSETSQLHKHQNKEGGGSTSGTIRRDTVRALDKSITSKPLRLAYHCLPITI